MIVILQKPASDEDIKNASEDYGDYIKITIDIEKEIIAIGGEYHFDAEQMLLQRSCKQDNIKGGGLDLENGRIETNAMINMRPNFNNSAELLDEDVKKKFIAIAEKYLKNYVKQ